MIEQKSQRLMAACTEGNLELVNRIASKFESTEELCEAEPSTGYTPLMMAARHGHLEIVEALIRLGHDSTEISRDSSNNNILMIAAEHGQLDVFETYANKFPRSVQMSNKQGWTPLIAAARYGATKMVEMMASKPVSYLSDDGEGKDYDPLDNYGSASDYEEDPLPPRPHPSTTHNYPAQHNHQQFSDSEDERHEVVSSVKQRVSIIPATVALPESPVSTRGRDSFFDRGQPMVHSSQPTSPISSRGHSSYSFDNRLSQNSLAPQGDNHSSLTFAASATMSQPKDTLPPVQESSAVRDSRNSWEENDSDEEPYPAEAYDYGRETESESEEEYEERPRSHSNHQNRYSGQSSVQQETSVHHKNNSDSDHSDYEYDHDYSHQNQPPVTAAPQLEQQHEHPGHQQHEHPEHQQLNDMPRVNERPQSQYSSASSSRRSSYEEDRLFAAGHSQHQDHKDRLSVDQPKSFYEDMGESAPNPNMFSNANASQRASVNSAKSFSSHTKHHSFGYEERPSALAEPSESESESSESDRERASAATVNAAPTSPPPPIPTRSRPTSTFSLASRTSRVSISTPGSPTLNRSMAPMAEHWDIKEESTQPIMAAAAAVSSRTSTPASSRPSSFASSRRVSATVAPVLTAPAPAPISAPIAAPAPASEGVPALAPEPVSVPASVSTAAPTPVHDTATTPQSPLAVDTVSQKSMSSASSLDQRKKRYSGSGSDTSGTSIDLHSPTHKSHLKTAPPNTFTRSLSSSSVSRETVANHGPGSPEKQRPISYAKVFSDAELNDVNLMDEPLSEKRVSANVPRTPVTPSVFGFPSNFFGAGRSHPVSQQQQEHLQHKQLPAAPLAQPATQASPVTASTPVVPPSPVENRTRSTSISAIASSIQGAFSRGFSSQSQPPLPPLPRTPSQISQRTSNAGAMANMSMDRRISSNRSNASERASVHSNMTNDSNMDMLLARLEAQNELLAQDSKRRATTESEMDRAIGHAKEESAGENIDWDYWGALMHDYNAVAKRNPKQLTTMIQKGVPAALRGQIWQLLAKSKDTQLEATFAELLKSTSSHEKQINRDMSRTFPNHAYFQSDGVGQEALFNVVKAYSLYDPEVGYCQGLSFVVGPLLLNMPEEEAFCMLVRMMGSYEMRGHYTPDMSTLQLRLYQFEQLMEETVPMVFKHLRNQGIRSTMYASQWFMTMFAYKFPLELVFRVYDIILVEGIESLLRFAVALLKANHDKILSYDFEVLIEFLKNGLFEPYMNDAGLFIQDAYNVKVTPKKLAQYTQKYQAMIQKQQAELAAEESLRESNKQLSAHVRRLEGSLHQLNKEHVDLAKELITRKVEMAQLQDQNDVLTQKVSDLTKIVDSQAKEVEEQYKGEIEDVLHKNMDLLKKNEHLEDQLSYMESLLVETKMKYAESEIERDGLSRKLSDLRKALGMQ
ncbi:GTPase-activating protein [Haplosporangium sp. Z 767]|nr:GTPase-activating protein [Haplosporangium sp. Z 767]KAF9182253.1 GTPase-activating protein [Haplosporangium sp. Z 11]